MDETWYERNIASPNMPQAPMADRVEPERILVIGQSSGTTGEPKFFPITAENAIRRTNPKYLLDPSPQPVVASMFHVLHAGIYFVLMRTLAKGGTIVFGPDRAHWRTAGITLLLASPMHLSQIFEGRAGKDSGKFPRVWLAGSPVYPAFLNQALNHFDEVLNAYGASEASIVCHQVFTQRASEGETISVGQAGDDVRLEVVDEHGIAVGTGEVGEVRYQSPLLTSGYIGDSETTRACFRNGWFHPGDTGYLNGQNQLFIVGRVNDLLNLGGTKVNAAVVDGVVQSAPGITDGACFTEAGTSGFERLSVVIVTMSRVRQDKVVGDLLKKLSRHFAPALLPTSVYIAETIPRNENGKVLRGAARLQSQSGAWPRITPAIE